MNHEPIESISWLDPWIQVAPSLIHGRGLCAARAIRPGELVARWGGRVLPAGALDTLKVLPRYDCAALSEDSIIVFGSDDPIIHCNHSCDSNLWMDSGIRISARRDIVPGEEVTIDYALFSDDPEWTMPCNCRSPLCRGTVRGDDWARPELHVRYAGHFMPYLTRRFQRDEAV